MEIKDELIFWYKKNKRDLPWRKTENPYLIWVSEIILQQTRVEQGLRYYHNFTEVFPDVKSLADAREDDVLKMWQGLGYYSRARNMHAAAKHIVNDLDGKFPENYAGIIKLKGIGPYTAAAISSFAYKHIHAVVDGNVIRVLSRIFDVETPVNSSQGKKEIDELAQTCISHSQPDTYNQAIMELGALICKPVNPICEECPLLFKCLARKRGTISERPVKVKSKPPKPRYMDYAVLESKEHLIFKKREDDDIWKGLYDFVLFEGVEEPSPGYITKEIEKVFPGIKLVETPERFDKKYTHLLSHQRITGRFWRFKINDAITNNSVYLSVPKQEVEQLAVSRLIHKYLEDSNYL